MAQYLILDSFPTEKLRLDEAENKYQVIMAGGCSATTRQPASARTSESTSSTAPTPSSSLVNEIAKAREHIKQSLDGAGVSVDSNVLSRLESLAAENQELKKVTADLAALVKKLEARVSKLEEGTATTPKESVEKPVSKQQEKEEEEDEDDDDDDFELFGDEDDEDEAAREKLKEERVAAYNAKKSKKPALIAKSSVLLDVKPWDDETDMEALEAKVRTIEMDGLLWGASKFVPVGYGIRKLQIMCVVEDEKVSIDDLSEQICEFEDYCQSVDIAAFSKI